MNYNPFIDVFPIESIKEWVGDKKIINELQYCVKVRTNTCILGPEGSGKTSLLKVAFSTDYRREMAEKYKKLIYFADLSNKNDGNDLCEYLAERFASSLNTLIKNKDVLKEMKEAIKEDDSECGQTKFHNIITQMKDNWGYSIVIVMDCFELFAMSKTVTQDHHDCLRSLIENGYIQCIAATNYDLTKDSLPEDIRGSYLFQKFTNFIEMKPFSQEDVVKYLQNKLEHNLDIMHHFKIEPIFKLCGGIPDFVRIIVKNTFDCISDDGEECNVKSAMKKAKDDCAIIMDNWCKLLTQSQIEVVKELVLEVRSNNEFGFCDFTGTKYETAVSLLLSRGLLRNYVYYDAQGNAVLKDYLVQFNSLMFQNYCMDGKMEAAVERNPLPEIEKQRRINLNATGNTYIETLVYHDESRNVQVNQVNNTMVQGISTREFLNMICDSESPEELNSVIGRRLQEHFQKNLDFECVTQAMEGTYSNQFERDVAIDRAYDQSSQKLLPVVQVDEDDDLTDITYEELQTFEEKFSAARKRIHTDLSDEILERQSERSQFYLKMAVIVEDALNLPGFIFDDYSAQLILYGKAAEQVLRDNLFVPFQKIEDLSDYDSFDKKKINKVYLSDFQFLIRDRKIQLKDLCSKITNFHMYSLNQPEDWNVWWTGLEGFIDKVREIRNKAAHAGTSYTEKTDLQTIYNLIVGDSENIGIINRVLVGKELCLKYVDQEIDINHVDEMIGKCYNMICTKLKTDGGIRGRLNDYGYAVNISKRKVQRFKGNSSVNIDVDSIMTVKILEFKISNEKSYFAAEIVEIL